MRVAISLQVGTLEVCRASRRPRRCSEPRSGRNRRNPVDLARQFACHAGVTQCQAALGHLEPQFDRHVGDGPGGRRPQAHRPAQVFVRESYVPVADGEASQSSKYRCVDEVFLSVALGREHFRAPGLLWRLPIAAGDSPQAALGQGIAEPRIICGLDRCQPLVQYDSSSGVVTAEPAPRRRPRGLCPSTGSTVLRVPPPVRHRPAWPLPRSSTLRLAILPTRGIDRGRAIRWDGSARTSFGGVGPTGGFDGVAGEDATPAGQHGQPGIIIYLTWGTVVPSDGRVETDSDIEI